MSRSSRLVGSQNEQGRRLSKPKFNFWSQQQDHKERKQPPISIRLCLNRKTCKAGGEIEGKISMFVPPSAMGCDDFSGIHLSLVGHEIVKLSREMSDHGSLSESDKIEVVRIVTEVVPLPSPLTAGQFENTFCWQLPADKILPVTMSCSSHDDSSCQLQYNVTAYLSSKSSEANPYPRTFSRKPISVTGSGKNVLDDNNNSRRNDDDNIISAEPKIFKVKPWLKSRGCIEFGVDTDTKVASPNSMVAVRITGRGNLSSVPVKRLVIQWVETVQWSGRYYEERQKSRVLAKAVVSVDKAPQWQPRKKTKGCIDEATATADSNDGSKISVWLSLNKSARDSYEGGKITVKHAINVTAITKGNHVANPKFTTPIEVSRKQLKQSEDGALSLRLTPVMANAQVFSSSSDDDTDPMDNSDDDAHHEDSVIRQDVELPRAVPINIDGYNDFARPLVIQGEMERRSPNCGSTENNVDDSGSIIQSIVSRQQILEPVLVMAVEE